MARENKTGIFEMPKEPELEDLFRIALRRMRLELRTNTVGRVVAYDPETQFVDVSVELLPVYKDLRTAPTQADPNPESVGDPIRIDGLRVAWPRTNAGYLTFPLQPGDTGEIRVQDRSLDHWLEVGQAVDPISAWTHTLASGIFCPCIWPATNPIDPGTDQTATVLHGELIKLGRDATDFVPLVQKLLSVLEDLRTWANTHTHTAPPGGGGTSPSVQPLGPIGDISATKVKAE